MIDFNFRFLIHKYINTIILLLFMHFINFSLIKPNLFVISFIMIDRKFFSNKNSHYKIYLYMFVTCIRTCISLFFIKFYMDNPSLHPFLRYVDDARRQAREEEDYDSAISNYNLARQEIEREISVCHDIVANQKWNKMLTDVIDERDSIIKIKTAYDRILANFDGDSDQNPYDGDGDEAVEPPQYHVEDKKDNMGQKQLKKPVRRDVLSKPQRNHVSPQARVPATPNIGLQGQRVKRPRVMVDPAPKPRPVVKVNPPKTKQKQNPIDNKKKKPDPLDPSTNPLVQQIIDMGILVREPNVQWDSIAGLDNVKRLLRQNLVILPMRPDIAKGLLSPWKSVLFYGPPGTGKTFLAKAVATECKRTFFNITSATITSRFLGESEKLVNHLFTLANQMAPSTIFFDEIDSIASQRGSGNENEASRRIKSELLTRLEGIDGASDSKSSVFVLAATNFPWDLDEALIRRFQKRIYIPLPDAAGRLSILKMNINDYVDDSFDFDGFAKKLDGYSCADITNLCRDAVQAVFDKMTSMIDTQEWLNMPAENAKVIVRNADFELAMKKRKSSVDPATLKRYEEWGRSRGAE